MVSGGHAVSFTYRRSSCSDQDGGEAKCRVDEACDEAGDLGVGEGGGGQGPLVETLAGQTSQGLRAKAAHFQPIGQSNMDQHARSNLQFSTSALIFIFFG